MKKTTSPGGAVFATDTAQSNGNYLKQRNCPETGMINVDLYSKDHHRIRLYAEVYCREDAQFICASFNANPAFTSLADNAFLLHQALFTLTDQFKSIKTSYSEYAAAVSETEKLLSEVTM